MAAADEDVEGLVDRSVGLQSSASAAVWRCAVLVEDPDGCVEAEGVAQVGGQIDERSGVAA